MRKEIWFDMDGTIADLYGVDNWLEYLINEDTTPYEVAKVLLNMQVLARLLNRLQTKGFFIGIVSWTSKNGTADYNRRVAEAKINWLKKHLKSVTFDRIDIIEYGTPKQNNRYGILFDDEAKNRDNWNDTAYDEKNILEILKALQCFFSAGDLRRLTSKKIF